MKNAQNPDHVALGTLLGWLREGRYVVPDFQREFEWGPWDIRDLVRSIFLDYYIGSLLLWKGKKENFAALSCEPIYGFTGAVRPSKGSEDAFGDRLVLRSPPSRGGRSKQRPYRTSSSRRGAACCALVADKPAP